MDEETTSTIHEVEEVNHSHNLSGSEKSRQAHSQHVVDRHHDVGSIIASHRSVATAGSLASIDRPPDEEEDLPPAKIYRPYSIHVLALLMPASIFGVLARLGLQALVTFNGQSIFPLAYVQAVGCFVMGLALGMKASFGNFYGPLYTAVTTGFCGSLTTFSGWQVDIFDSWINSGQFHRTGLDNLIDGLTKTWVTLLLSLASLMFGVYISGLILPWLPSLDPPKKHARYCLTVLSILTYAATLPAYFRLPANYRHQATAALLFSYPGTLTRYLLSINLNPRIKLFPLGTFTANAVGTALLGVFHVLEGVPSVSPNACSLLQGLADGYCGCLTTVSTFAAEVDALEGWKASFYVTLSWMAGQLLLLIIMGSSYWAGHVSEQLSGTIRVVQVAEFEFIYGYPIEDSSSCFTASPIELCNPSMSRTQEQVEDRVELEEEAVSGNGEVDEIMDEVDEGYTSSTPTSTLTWISWFCSLPGHEYFCEVSEDFIEDDFNLTGLNTMVPFWKEAMEMVLDVEPDEDTSKIPDVSIVEASAELLYGLVHQRYILTRAGLQSMVDKYEGAAFGVCPRVYCMGCNVVPCGRSDLPGIDTVKLYCPNCNDIYSPPSSRFQGVDGAFFGTTFAHLFFQSYRELAPAPFWKASSSTESSLSPGRSPDSVNSSQRSPFINPNPHGGQKRPEGRIYEPRIYGFKVSERAKSGPRMQWLRLRPQSPEALDMVDWRGRWIDDEEYGDVDEDDLEEGGKQMEDFDPDIVEDDDDEEEEEEEEEGGARRHHIRGEQSVDLLRPPTPIHLPSSARTSPTSGSVSKDPDDHAAGLNGIERVRVVRR